MASAPAGTGFLGGAPPAVMVTGPARSGRGGVPWYLWVGVVAVTSASIGGSWDVSWHRSIGRDTFWTPAHMAIYLCGVLAGIVGMVLVTRATFGRSAGAAELRSESVTMFGLRAPLGVFLAGWGGVAMLTSAPFDNWWHNAYGLDVKIVSPPHTLLIFGIRAVSLGMMFLILAAMNRAANSDASVFPLLQKLFLYLGGIAVVGQMFFVQEYTWDIVLHQGSAYVALAIAVPVVLAVLWQASRYKWAATVCCAIYMVFVIGEILIFPLFPAQPKLGPVYFPVTHLVPAKFPVLLLPSAFALDLLWQRTKSWKLWQIAIVSGIVFMLILAPIEWNFANFLLSHHADNRFFGSAYFDYTARPGGYERARRFFKPMWGEHLAISITLATVYAMISSWLGLAFGRWMRGVQR